MHQLQRTASQRLAVAVCMVILFAPPTWAQGAGKTRISQGVIEDAVENAKPTQSKDGKSSLDAKDAKDTKDVNKPMVIKTGPTVAAPTKPPPTVSPNAPGLQATTAEAAQKPAAATPKAAISSAPSGVENKSPASVSSTPNAQGTSVPPATVVPPAASANLGAASGSSLAAAPAVADTRVNGMALTRELRSLTAPSSGGAGAKLGSTLAAGATPSGLNAAAMPQPMGSAAKPTTHPAASQWALPAGWTERFQAWVKSAQSAPVWALALLALVALFLLWWVAFIVRRLWRKFLGRANGTKNRSTHDGTLGRSGGEDGGRRSRKDARTPSYLRNGFEENEPEPTPAGKPPHVQEARARFNKNIFNTNIYSAALDAQKSSAQASADTDRIAASEQAQLQNLRAVVESAKLHRVLAHASIKQI